MFLKLPWSMALLSILQLFCCLPSKAFVLGGDQDHSAHPALSFSVEELWFNLGINGILNDQLWEARHFLEKSGSGYLRFRPCESAFLCAILCERTGDWAKSRKCYAQFQGFGELCHSQNYECFPPSDALESALIAYLERIRQKMAPHRSVLRVSKTLVIQFKLGANGKISGVTVIKSSGQKYIDAKYASSLVRMHLEPFPVTLRGKKSLALRFDFHDGQIYCKWTDQFSDGQNLFVPPELLGGI